MNKAILHKGIDLLSRREHSSLELSRKLEQKGFVREEVTEVVSFLTSENYLSDLRFAESLIRSRVAKGYGWLYIQQELRQKGVDDNTTAIAKAEQEIDWSEQIALTYSKKFGNSLVKDDKDKAKRARFLQYRGYSYDQVMAILND